jgi:hypothetical protein
MAVVRGFVRAYAKVVKSMRPRLAMMIEVISPTSYEALRRARSCAVVLRSRASRRRRRRRQAWLAGCGGGGVGARRVRLPERPDSSLAVRARAVADAAKAAEAP